MQTATHFNKIIALIIAALMLFGCMGIQAAQPVIFSNELPEGYQQTTYRDIAPLLQDKLTLMSTGSGVGKKINLAFIIDATGSMGDEIYNVKASLARFAELIEATGATLRMSLIEYKDIDADGFSSTVVHKFDYSAWTSNVTTMVERFSNIFVNGGGDYEETILDALGYVVDDATMTFNSDAYKFAFVLTDATYKISNRHGYSNLAQVINKLKEKNIRTSVITNTSCQSTYSPLYLETGGIWADINGDFSAVLSEYAQSITDITTRSKQAVYILPGYLGSELYSIDDHAKFWEDMDKIKADVTAFAWPFGAAGDTMGLDEAGNASKLEVKPSEDDFGTRDEYKTLIEYLRAQLGDSYDIVFFPYDWRRSLKFASQSLETDIAEKGYEKVSFVCHSTGGLLAATYLSASRENKKKTDKVVTLASPLFGTYMALEPLETGTTPDLPKTLKDAGISESDQKHVYKWAKTMLRNSPCTYQLLPSIEYLLGVPNVYNIDGKASWVKDIGTYYNILGASKSNLNRGMLDGSGESHKTLRESYFKDSILDVFKDVDSLHLGSIGMDTPAIASYKTDFWGKTSLSDMMYKKDGDGTVLINSALGMTDGKNAVNTEHSNFIQYNGISHGDMTKNPIPLSATVNFIKSMGDIGLYDVAGGGGGSSSGGGGFISGTMANRSKLKFSDEEGSPSTIKNVEIIREADGVIVAQLIDGVANGFDNVNFSYFYLTDNFSELIIYLPNDGYKVVVMPQVPEGDMVLMSEEGPTLITTVSSLDEEGSYTASATFNAFQSDHYLEIDTNGASPDTMDDVLAVQVEKSTGEETIIEDKDTKTDYTNSVTIITDITVIEKGTIYALAASTVPEGAALTWGSSDSEVLSVDAFGNITAMDYGIAKIFATSEDGNKSDSITITVPKEADGISFESTSYHLEKGEKQMLGVAFTPFNATNRNILYSTDNSSVAEIGADGVVTALAKGECTVTAITSNGKTATTTIFVDAPEEIIPATGLSILEDRITLKLGEAYEILASVQPDTATDQNVFWYSSDESIVSASPTEDSKRCVLHAQSPGIATITAVSSDGGYTDFVEVEVTNDSIPVTGVELYHSSATLHRGDVGNLAYTVYPLNATNKKVLWSTSDSFVATVIDGVVIAKNVGQAIIQVTTEDGGKTAECLLTVLPDEAYEANVSVPKCSFVLPGKDVEVPVTIDKTQSAVNFECMIYYDPTILDYTGYADGQWSGENAIFRVIKQKEGIIQIICVAMSGTLYEAPDTETTIATLKFKAKPTAPISFVPMTISGVKMYGAEGDADKIVVGGIDGSVEICRVGEITGNGIINLNDVSVVVSLALGYTAGTNRERVCADISGDGSIGIEDALMLLDYYTGILPKLIPIST